MKENQTVLNYMCAHFNWIEIQIVEIIASRAGVFALSPPEMMKLREVCGASQRWFQARGRRGKSLLASKMVA